MKNVITIQVQIITDQRGMGVKTAVAGAPKNPMEAMLLGLIRSGITAGLQSADGLLNSAGATKPMESHDGDAADIAQKILQPETPTPAPTEPGKN